MDITFGPGADVDRRAFSGIRKTWVHNQVLSVLSELSKPMSSSIKQG